MNDNSNELPFPRGKALPRQPARHWAQQKDRYIRRLLAEDIEQTTQRQLVVYFSDRFSDHAEINEVDVADLYDALSEAGSKPVDLMIETNGGFVDAADSLVSMITAAAPDLRVIVPNAAKSCGTLIALCAKSIVMGAPSELGPIEPHVGGWPSTLLMDPQTRTTDFERHWFGQQAYQHMEHIAKQLLTNLTLKDQPEKIDTTLNALLSRDHFHSHGSVINHRDAQALGLNVEYLRPDNDLWQRIWLLYCMYDEDCRSRGLTKIVESRNFTRQRTPLPVED